MNLEKWNEFLERLEGEEGCNFKYLDEEAEKNEDHTKITWDCSKKYRVFSYSEKILKNMGFKKSEIDNIINIFIDNGGLCDCCILFNLREKQIFS